LKKRLTILISIFAACAAGIAIFFLWEQESGQSAQVTRRDMLQTLDRLGRLNTTNPEPVVVPIDLKRPVRLAIGSLGFPDDEQNGRVQDLVLADLTGAPGVELVERQSLESVLSELNLSVSGLVRAKDAVRVGKLLKAEWFLLGTGVKIAGTNSVVLRIVDARTGILRDVGVFDAEKPAVDLSSDIAAFARESRQSAASPKPRVFLAVGAFQDLSMNARQLEFRQELRSYLTVAYRGSGVTLLEREAVDTLLREVQLDLAGLIEGGETNAPQAMQSAYWLVDGAYQSYETTNFQVELVLNLSRMFGRYQRLAFRGPPDETLFWQVKRAIDLEMKTNAAIPWPTRNSEAHVQMLIGKDLAHLNSAELIWPENYQQVDAAEAARRRYNAEEAIRAFQTVLLLDPTNREAKLWLAACLRRQSFRHMEEARNYYRQIIEDPVQDKLTGTAQYALPYSFRWESPAEKASWFKAVNLQISNSAAAQYYRGEAEGAEKEAVLSRGGTAAREITEKELFEKMTNAMLGTICGNLGTEAFVESFGTNKGAAAQRLMELYPEMKAKAPNLTPYLLAAVVVEQLDTNAPVVAEFQKLLEGYAENPDEVGKSKMFWNHIQYPVWGWSFDHKVYRMAAAVVEGEIRAAALDPSHSMHIEDQDKMILAFAYLRLNEWQKALGIFETYSNRPVRMGSSGPWGEAYSLVLTSKEAAFCREKLGLPPVANPLEFDMGQPLLCLCTPSTFVADDSGLWVGIQGQLVRLSFDLRTNLVVPLPMSPSTTITTISLDSSNVWVGTAGEGLIKYDASTHQCRQFTAEDGLANDSIVSSQLQGGRLWIGYVRGLGYLNLSTQKFITFTASITEGVEKYGKSASNSVTAGQAPRDGVGAIAIGPAGQVFFTSANYRVNRYRIPEQAWDVVSQMGAVSCLAADANRLAVGQDWSSYKDASGPIAISVMNFKDQQWSTFKAVDGLPAGSVTSVALDGNKMWVGGSGYIAVLDAVRGTILRYAYVQTDGYHSGVDRIQIGGGYVWARINWHLYRAPLSGLY
jgi:hypothetical protein